MHLAGAGVCALAKYKILRQFESVHSCAFVPFTHLFPGETPSISGLLQANLSSLSAAMLETHPRRRNRFQDGEKTRANNFLAQEHPCWSKPLHLIIFQYYYLAN